MAEDELSGRVVEVWGQPPRMGLEAIRNSERGPEVFLLRLATDMEGVQVGLALETSKEAEALALAARIAEGIAGTTVLLPDGVILAREESVSARRLPPRPRHPTKRRGMGPEAR